MVIETIYNDVTLITRKRLSALMFLVVIPLFFPQLSPASLVGVYGVDKDRAELTQYSVGAVFLPPKNEIIKSQIAAGREVFLTLNVFGGRGAWEMFPDAIPITVDGKRLNDVYGGICPTHPEWRKNRLSVLADWLRRFGGGNGISGVWLDFIRYPGKWEHEHPDIPDTCYCDRCLTLFQVEKSIKIPSELVLTKDKAAWIKAHVPLEWLGWKKEQITSFVRDARGVLEKNSEGKKLKFGVFLVPWRKSDFAGALSFQLAQDAELFGPYVDVYSPMVYYRMVGQTIDWVRDISHYYKDMVEGEVWPIIQAENVSDDEFGDVVNSVSASGVDGLLVYKYSSMKDGHWSHLAAFSPGVNLILNSTFEAPLAWVSGGEGTIDDTQFMHTSPDDSGVQSIGISGGRDRQGTWSIGLQDCDPDGKYRFIADFFRHDRSDGRAYPEVSIWGQSYQLNTHRMYGGFQNLSAEVTCPDVLAEKDKLFSFINRHPGTTFWMRNPQLLKQEDNHVKLQLPPAKRFFPIGVYGASGDNLQQIKKNGLNSAVIRLDKKNIMACLESNLHCTLAIPREPEKLLVLLDQFEELIREGDFSFYVNDEPGIHSFPVWKTADIQRIIKGRFPESFTNMAIVRPQAIPDYQAGADYFMLDQYPIPNMPMTWLSDSLDEAAGYVGQNRLQAVIQAFGGGKFADAGWPRLPTFAEMNCLAFLSVIHGSRGIYFYTYPIITSTPESSESFKRVIGRLNSIRSWLLRENVQELVQIRMTSKNRFDPQGRPAIHCSQKMQYNTRMLICANTIRTDVEAAIAAPAGSVSEWQDYFSGDAYYVVDGELHSRFEPLEVKVLLERR